MSWTAKMTNSEVDIDKITVTFDVLDDADKILFSGQQLQFHDVKGLSEELINLQMIERVKLLELAKTMNDKIKLKIGVKLEKIS